MTHAYTVGAHPRYAPQMAESIVVQKLPGWSLSREDGQQVISVTDSRPLVSYKILWTDTGGSHHGRAWTWNPDWITRYVDAIPDVAYPLAIASTEAGAIWVWRWRKEDFAEIQTPQPLGSRPRITIEEIDPYAGLGQVNRSLLGDDLVWRELPRCDDPEEKGCGLQMWFADDQGADDEVMSAAAESFDHWTHGGYRSDPRSALAKKSRTQFLFDHEDTMRAEGWLP